MNQALRFHALIDFGKNSLVHFCKKCLRSTADRCGKRCPKCRQLISNGRSCTVNTVLWNTIQLLFPQEIEARKVVAGGSNTKESGESFRNNPEICVEIDGVTGVDFVPFE
ncbi:hypothetical protein L6452_39655 [Arctium lappa]|uniref:Uncharacterized protein n=1 Tax=Arctium lappa TaxID=4217 RepID=A0ACB8XUK6_ARCLA|nr:hypothetical protein L6452_39655 [Arctium lappa]